MATIIKANGTQEEIQPANGTDFTLEEAQAVVGGLVELVYLADGRLMLVNEEGLLNQLPFNGAATELNQFGGIVGDVLVCASEQFL